MAPKAVSPPAGGTQRSSHLPHGPDEGNPTAPAGALRVRWDRMKNTIICLHTVFRGFALLFTCYLLFHRGIACRRNSQSAHCCVTGMFMGGKHALPAADTSDWVEICSPGKLGRVKTHFCPVRQKTRPGWLTQRAGCLHCFTHWE